MFSRIANLFRRQHQDDGHESIRSLSSDYIDEDLDEASVSRVRSHIEMCPPCMAFFNTLKATVKLLGASKRRQHAPPHLKDRIKERVQREKGA